MGPASFVRHHQVWFVISKEPCTSCHTYPVSRGFGVAQRRILLSLSADIAPTNGIRPTWVWRPVSDIYEHPGLFPGEVQNVPSLRSLKRAAHSLADDGWVWVDYVDHGGHSYSVQGDRPPVATTRETLSVTLPSQRDESLPLDTNSDMAAHFEGLLETTATVLGAPAAQLDKWMRSTFDRRTAQRGSALIALWELYLEALEKSRRRVSYHHAALDGMPCSVFSWRWLYARWLGDLYAQGDARVPPLPWEMLSVLPGLLSEAGFNRDVSVATIMNTPKPRLRAPRGRDGTSVVGLEAHSVAEGEKRGVGRVFSGWSRPGSRSASTRPATSTPCVPDTTGHGG